MYFFIDTETTGIDFSKDRIIQIAWILADDKGVTKLEKMHIIRPEGFSIPNKATEIHGITNEFAKLKGISSNKVLGELLLDLASAKYIIGHNILFDLGMLKNEFYHSRIEYPFNQYEQICTMMHSVSLCALPKVNGRSGYKRPKLSELHFKLFNKYFDGAHDALEDTRACMRCFYELKKLGLILGVADADKLANTSIKTEVDRNLSIASTIETNDFQIETTNSSLPSFELNPKEENYKLKNKQEVRYENSEEEEISNIFIRNANLITVEDEDNFGADLIDLARRITYESKVYGDKKLKEKGTSNFIFQNDIDTFDDDLIDLARNVTAYARSIAYKLHSEDQLNNYLTEENFQVFGGELIEVLYKAAREAYDVETPSELGLLLDAYSDDLTRMTQAARNIKCSEKTLVYLADDAVNENLMLALVSNESLPNYLINELISCCSDGLLEAAATNKNCDSLNLAKIIWFSNFTLFELVVRHPAFKYLDFYKLLKEKSIDEYWETRLLVAEYDNCPEFILMALTKDSKMEVREAVARNKNISEAVLRALAKDTVEEIIEKVLSHSNCPIDILIKFSTSENSYLKKLAQSNLYQLFFKLFRMNGKEEQSFIVQNADKETLLKLINHPNITAEFLSLLSDHENGYVRIAVAKHRLTPEKVLENYSQSKFYEYRLAVAENPNTPLTVLKKLSCDDDINVKKAAIKSMAENQIPLG